MANKDVTKWLARSASIAQMGAGLGSEITDVVERMHGSIGQKPLPWAKLESEHTKGITGFVYGCVKTSMASAHWGLRHAAHALAELDEDDATWLPIQAAMNGVCGDGLEDKGNPLAIDMQFVEELPAPSENSDTLLLFIHGLCMAETGWLEPGHLQAREQLAKQLNARTAYLRYNSGLHISENAEQFAQLIEDYAAQDKNIVIVGHSMGGLITRSACHYAAAHSHQWTRKLNHVVCLGTPHNGAPAERLGNFANGLLKMTPYTTPLARLGNLRSAAICDLRHGNLLHQDWQGIDDPDHHEDLRTAVPLLDSARYLFVAGTRSETVPESPYEAKHDLLVTVASAWAESQTPERRLDSDKITRKLVANTDHMNLLWSAEVYQLISEWLPRAR